jgi:hypothetical protein
VKETGKQNFMAFLKMVLSKHLPGEVMKTRRNQSAYVALAEIQSIFLIHTSYSRWARRRRETDSCCEPHHSNYSSAHP